jgi:hypothetical protein
MAESILFLNDTTQVTRNVSTNNPLPVTLSGSASSSASAGGDTVYQAKPGGINADGTVAYTAATQITVTGLPYTFTKNDVVSILQIPTSGDVRSYTDLADISVSGGVITVAGATFAASDTFIVTLTGQRKAPFDSLTAADKIISLNGDRTYFAPLLQEDIVNIPAATPAVRYLDVEGCGEILVQYDVINLPTGPGTLTLTVHASAENNGTVDSSAAYVDICQYGTDIETGAAAASLTADGALRINTRGWKFIRLTITATTADDGDASLYVNRAY